MLTIARNKKTGKEDNAKNAIPGDPYECIYCGVQLHFCRKGFYVRNDGQPEHKRGAACFNMVSRSISPAVRRKIELTRRTDFFGALESREDHIPDIDDEDPPLIDTPDAPGDFNDFVDPSGPYKDCPQLPAIDIGSLWTAHVPSEVVSIIDTVKEYNITQLSAARLDLSNLNITEDDLLHFTTTVGTPNLLSERDFEVLAALVDHETKRFDNLRVNPIRTLKQFDDADIIFLPPGTHLADCDLKSVFLSYYHSGFRETFQKNYKTLGKRILYCQAKAFTFDFGDGRDPYLQFQMYWNNNLDNMKKEYYNIRLYLNFNGNESHTANERFEFFVTQHFRKKMAEDGSQIWVPQNAKKSAKNQKFDALLYGDWKCSSKDQISEVNGVIKHKITLRTNYFNAKQLLFVRGYNG